MQGIRERIIYAVGAALLGVLIAFFFCLELGTFSESATAFILVPGVLAVLGFLAGDKALRVMGRIIRWL